MNILVSKYRKMVLQKETKFGLNYGQILATLSLIIMLGGYWVQVKVKLQSLEIRVEQLEKLRQDDQVKMETIRLENREDHQAIMIKLDDLMKRQK